MSTSESPAGARRRLRLALRKHREQAGRTQGQVADDLSWSISKVNRIENGEVTISRTDLQALLQLLGVKDEHEIDRLVEDARLSRVRGWWDRPEYRPHLNDVTRKVIQIESEASAIRSFQIVFFPGLLQTRDYAAVAIDAAFDGASEETRSARVEVRMLRQAHARNRSIKAKHLVIIDEFILQRIIGSAFITSQQLRAVADAAREPDVLIRLLPKEESKFLHQGTFVVYEMEGEEDAFLLREILESGEIVQSVEAVEKFRASFEQMWDRCLTEDATLSAIEAQYALIRAELDRYS